MDILFLDHYDSFSFNLIDWLGGKGCPYNLHRLAFDAVDLEKIRKDPMPLVLSPGPKTPCDAQATLDIVQTLWGKVPMFGICLGHQIIGHYLGAPIKMAYEPFHGSVREIKIRRQPRGMGKLPDRLQAASYNSLVVDRTQLDEEWVFAENIWGEVEGIYLNVNGFVPVLGLQFHPESFLSSDQELFRQWWWQTVVNHYQGGSRINAKLQRLLPYQFPHSSVL